MYFKSVSNFKAFKLLGMLLFTVRFKFVDLVFFHFTIWFSLHLIEQGLKIIFMYSPQNTIDLVPFYDEWSVPERATFQ